MSTLKGIDVSKHQGIIDWTKVDVDFVIIRAGYGKFAFQKDSKFDVNMKGAIDHGIPVGVYWYSYATTVADAKKEADVCLSVIKKYKEHITLPVFFDQEYEPGILKLTNTVRTEICKTFIEVVKRAGYESGLYASADWFKHKVNAGELIEYPAWIAQYASKCTYTGKNLYAWQYSSKGKVSGITGNVDMNVGYFDLFKKDPEPTTKTNEVDPAKSFHKKYAKTYEVTAHKLNMRSGASTTKKVIKVLENGDNVTCYGYYTVNGSTTWLYVKDADGNVGFCSKKFLK